MKKLFGILKIFIGRTLSSDSFIPVYILSILFFVPTIVGYFLSPVTSDGPFRFLLVRLAGYWALGVVVVSVVAFTIFLIVSFCRMIRGIYHNAKYYWKDAVEEYNEKNK